MDSNSIDDLKNNFEITFDETLWKNTKKLKEIIKDHDGLIVRNKTQVNKDILSNANNLKFIGRLGVGLDNIDTEFCKAKNIHVQPATGMNADSVAEFVISSSMSLIKKIPMFHNGTVKGDWPRTIIKSAEINVKCIGIVGFGYALVMVSTFGRTQAAALEKGFKDDIETLILHFLKNKKPIVSLCISPVIVAKVFNKPTTAADPAMS